MKKEVSAERRVKLLARSKLYAGNLVKGINAWAVGIVRYSAGILDWTRQDLKSLDVKTRKTLSMCGAFHTKSSVLRLYLKRAGGGRGLISVEDCVRMEEANLAKYLGSSSEWMLEEVARAGIVSGVESGEEYRKRIEVERTESLRGRGLHGKFFREFEAGVEAGEVDKDRSWQWLKAGFLTKATESFIIAAQEQALRTNFVRATIDQVEGVDANCRVCGLHLETVKHVVSGCSELAKKQYKIRHDKMGTRVHWELCKKYGIKCGDKWYNHTPESYSSTDDGTNEIYWDKKVITPVSLEHNTPDLIVIEKGKKWTIVDFSVPLDQNVKSKEDEKLNMYGPLAGEVGRIHKVRTEIIPIVIGALGTVPKRLPKFISRLGIPDVIGCLQTAALLGSQRILRNTLGI